MRASTKFGLLFFSLVSILLTYGQDPSFSQYKFNKIYFNPAYGGYNGEHHFNASYRTLWPNVPGRPVAGPLSNYMVAGDYFFKEAQPKRWQVPFTGSIGGFVSQDFEGQGFLTTSFMGVTFAQHFPIVQKASELPRLMLSIGLKAYATNVRVNWDKLVYSSQLDVDYGITGSVASVHSGIGQRWGGDLDAGILVSSNFRGADSWYNELGFAAAHIASSPLALSGTNDMTWSTPLKLSASYRTKVPVAAKRLYIGLTALFEKQANFYELNTGADLYVKLGSRSSNTPLIFTAAYRTSFYNTQKNTKSVIFGVGHEGFFKGARQPTAYYLAFAADMPVKGLGYQTFGAYEISLGISVSKKSNNGKSECVTF